MSDYRSGWTDPLDPSNPLQHWYWSDWVCPVCAEDGDDEDLVDGRCYVCGSHVEMVH